MKNLNNMKPEELEIKINDAADGLLSEAELNDLEKALANYPGLLQDYRDIMKLPEISGVYGNIQPYKYQQQTDRILHVLEKEDEKTAFNAISVIWFRKYALAASFLILSFTSVFYFTQPELINSEVSYEEIFYPYEESSTDDYITYLDEWFEQ